MLPQGSILGLTLGTGSIGRRHLAGRVAVRQRKRGRNGKFTRLGLIGEMGCHQVQVLGGQGLFREELFKCWVMESDGRWVHWEGIFSLGPYVLHMYVYYERILHNLDSHTCRIQSDLPLNPFETPH